MNPIVSIEIPIKLRTQPNYFENPYSGIARRKNEINAVAVLLNSKKGEIPLPCNVVLTRIGKACDSEDNLRFAFKTVKDKVADIIIPGLKIGRADGDPRISWEYKQEPKGKRKDGFRIEIYLADQQAE